MKSLHDKLTNTNKFLIGTELVSIRGSMAERSAVKARSFANDLIASSSIDWISITDNAGGNPQMAPQALGKPILYAGKEVVIHLTCKDMNRNGLESEAWSLYSEGYRNILAMTGDYPVVGNAGAAKPVFDIDSVGLIAMLSEMNAGFNLYSGANSTTRQLEKTNFNIGAVTSNFKFLEGEVIPQYHKLRKKVECGAHFIINQIGFDSRKQDELIKYRIEHKMQHIPLIGNTYILNPRVAEVFHQKRIPGVVVSDELLAICQKHGSSGDKGKSFFYELAAKQMAIFKGLGYKGAYIGGVYNYEAIDQVLEIEKTFGVDDWREFAKEISYSRAGEFYYYAQDEKTGLADSSQRDQANQSKGKGGSAYGFSKLVHKAMFDEKSPIAKISTSLCKNSKDPGQGPKVLRRIEKVGKLNMFDCKDCGDCSLPEIAFLCPESACAKNQRNGPCGGTKDGKCEVTGYGDCIWLRAYERLKSDGKEDQLLDHAPVVQDQSLRGTSSWANHWLQRDHAFNTYEHYVPQPKITAPKKKKKTVEKQSTEAKSKV